MKEEKAVVMNSFKTKRGDGLPVRTVYGMLENRTVFIERRLVSTITEDGYEEVRKIGKAIYQIEHFSFKFDSFFTIAQDLFNYSYLLDPDKILRGGDVLENPDEEIRVINPNRKK